MTSDDEHSEDGEEVAAGQSWLRRLKVWTEKDSTFVLGGGAAIALVLAVWHNAHAYQDTYEFYSKPGLPLRHLLGAGGLVVYLVIFFSVVHLTRRFAHMVLGYLAAIGFWAAATAALARGQASTPYSPRDWLSTTWYWTLDPLPIDLAGPASWEPPVQEMDSQAWLAIVGLEIYTLLLVLGGAGLIVARFRKAQTKS